jgi:hypothetical protein
VNKELQFLGYHRMFRIGDQASAAPFEIEVGAELLGPPRRPTGSGPGLSLLAV